MCECQAGAVSRQIPDLEPRPQVIIRGICWEGFVVNESRSSNQNPPIVVQSSLNLFAFLSLSVSWLLLLCAEPKGWRSSKSQGNTFWSGARGLDTKRLVLSIASTDRSSSPVAVAPPLKPIHYCPSPNSEVSGEENTLVPLRSSFL